jgi:hypothetical protein
MLDVDAKVFDRSDEITANCSRKRSNNLYDQGDKSCLDLPNILWIIIAFSRFSLEKNASGISSRKREFTTRSPASQSGELEFLPYCYLTSVAPFRDDFLDEEELRPAETVARLFKRVTLVVGHSVASCGRPTRFGRRRRIPARMRAGHGGLPVR